VSRLDDDDGDADVRDPHLRQALRHAPDAQLEAPPALGEFILKEARAKARGPGAALPDTTPRWATRLWAWLARPAVATSFAGVMAATLVGLMWWDQPMDEALPRHPAPAEAPLPATPASAPEPVAPAAPVAQQPSTQADRAAPRSEPTRKAAAGATTGTGTAPARAQVEPAAVAAAPQAPLAPPAPAPSAEASADALRANGEEQKRERSSIAPAEATSRRAAAKAQLNESRLQLEGEAYARVASVRAAIAGEPSRWAWQRADTTQASAQPMNDAVYAWLAELDASTGTGWQPRSGREPAAPRGRALALLRDGHAVHSFQLTERGVLWQRGQTAWHTELPADALAALQAALDSAAP
jgi:hypothetical protein